MQREDLVASDAKVAQPLAAGRRAGVEDEALHDAIWQRDAVGALDGKLIVAARDGREPGAPGNAVAASLHAAKERVGDRAQRYVETIDRGVAVGDEDLVGSIGRRGDRTGIGPHRHGVDRAIGDHIAAELEREGLALDQCFDHLGRRGILAGRWQDHVHRVGAARGKRERGSTRWGSRVERAV